MNWTLANRGEPLSRRLGRLYDRHAWPIVALAVLSVLLSLLYSSRHLSLSVDRSDMVDASDPVQADWNAYRQEFGGAWDYVVLVRAQDRGRIDEARLAVEELGRRLEQNPHFENVLYRVDLPQLKTASLYFLSLDDLRHLRDQVLSLRPWLRAAEEGSEPLLQSLSQGSPQESARRLEPALGLLNGMLHQLLRSLDSRGTSKYQSPIGSYQPEVSILRGQHVEPGQTRFYTCLEDGMVYMLLAQQRDRSHTFQGDTRVLQSMRDLLEEMKPQHPGVDFLLSGEPVIFTDETISALGDTARAGVLAVIVVAVLLMLDFGTVQAPLAVIISLLVGISWSAAYSAYSLGRLNILTINFGTILVGLGMSFGIHLLYRYQEMRSRGLARDAAMAATLHDSVRSNLVGAFTTSVAFLALHFTSFRPAGELGLITGVGVLLCYLAMVTMLPGLILMADRYRPFASKPRLARLGPLYHKTVQHPGLVLGFSVVFSLYCLTWTVRIPFDYNLMHLQRQGENSLLIERYMQNYGYTALYGLSICDSLEAARKESHRLLQDPCVARVESVASFVPAELSSKSPVIQEILGLLRDVRPLPAAPRRSALDLQRMYERYRETRARLRQVFPYLPGEAGREFAHLCDELDRRLDPENPGPVEDGLNAFERDLRADVVRQLDFLKSQKAEVPDVLAAIPAPLKARTLSPSGKVCLRIFPSQDCWKREALERFVLTQKKRNPHVTGNPVMIYYYLEDMRKAYAESARNSFLVIVGLLVLHFRSLRLAGLALFPKLLGILWMVGVLGMRGDSFNPVNCMALPLALGIGLLYGVNALKPALEGREETLFDDSTGPSILLCGLTTIAGFATLLLAEHRGVVSFGAVMTIGVAMNLLTSLFTLPCLLHALRGRRRSE